MRHLLVLTLLVRVCMAQQFLSGQAARAVIGQPYFTASFPGASQALVGAVSGLAYANDALFVADSNRAGATPVNNRVLIYHNLSSQFPEPRLKRLQRLAIFLVRQLLFQINAVED